MQESPDFRRFAVRRGAELTLVDLVIDRAPQLFPEKVAAGRVRLDPLPEIAANKLCALIGRAEIRDLVDLQELLRRGHDLEGILAAARAKEGGIDPATLAWVLSEMVIVPGAAMPAGMDPAALDRFRLELIDRLARLSLPQEDPHQDPHQDPQEGP